MRLVTALYRIDGGSFDPSKYVELVRVLTDGLTLPLTVFADGACASLLCGKLPHTANVIHRPLESFDTYKKIVSAAPALPLGRSIKKDTLEFIALMNNKLDFCIAAAEEFPNETNFSWIDAGIVKIFRDRNGAIQRLNESVAFASNGILIAGITKELTNRVAAVQRPCWRFAGGYFATSRRSLYEFHKQYRETLEDMLRENHITWETNLWALTELRGAPVIWFPANHDDRIVCIPQRYLGSK